MIKGILGIILAAIVTTIGIMVILHITDLLLLLAEIFLIGTIIIIAIMFVGILLFSLLLFFAFFYYLFEKKSSLKHGHYTLKDEIGKNEYKR